MVDSIANESKLLTITPNEKKSVIALRHEPVSFKLIFLHPLRENPGKGIRMLPKQTSFDSAGGTHEIPAGWSAGEVWTPASAR